MLWLKQNLPNKMLKWYIIDAKWILKFKTFTSTKDKFDQPGPITNINLLDQSIKIINEINPHYPKDCF